MHSEHPYTACTQPSGRSPQSQVFGTPSAKQWKQQQQIRLQWPRGAGLPQDWGWRGSARPGRHVGSSGLASWEVPEDRGRGGEGGIQNRQLSPRVLPPAVPHLFHNPAFSTAHHPGSSESRGLGPKTPAPPQGGPPAQGTASLQLATSTFGLILLGDLARTAKPVTSRKARLQTLLSLMGALVRDSKARRMLRVGQLSAWAQGEGWKLSG